MKEEEIDKGLTLLEYLEWCKDNNVLDIVNIKSSESCTKKEILNYSSFLNKEHKNILSNKQYRNENAKMFKCYTCDYAEGVSKGVVSPGGTQEYIVTCIKEKVCIMVNWNVHISDLPCWRERALSE